MVTLLPNPTYNLLFSGNENRIIWVVSRRKPGTLISDRIHTIQEHDDPSKYTITHIQDNVSIDLFFTEGPLMRHQDNYLTLQRTLTTYGLPALTHLSYVRHTSPGGQRGIHHLLLWEAHDPDHLIYWVKTEGMVSGSSYQLIYLSSRLFDPSSGREHFIKVSLSSFLSRLNIT